MVVMCREPWWFCIENYDDVGTVLWKLMVSRQLQGVFRCASISRSDDRHWLTDWQTEWKLTVLYHLRSHHWDWDSSQSLKMECQSKWNVPQNGMSLNMECHSKWNVAQNGMSLKIECHLKRNVTQNGMSLKPKCHSKWNVTQNGMSHKIECHSKWNVTQNWM